MIHINILVCLRKFDEENHRSLLMMPTDNIAPTHGKDMTN